MEMRYNKESGTHSIAGLTIKRFSTLVNCLVFSCSKGMAMPDPANKFQVNFDPTSQTFALDRLTGAQYEATLNAVCFAGLSVHDAGHR